MISRTKNTRRLQKSDMGQYLCQLRSSQGDASAYYDLNIGLCGS